MNIFYGKIKDFMICRLEIRYCFCVVVIDEFDMFKSSLFLLIVIISCFIRLIYLEVLYFISNILIK